MGNRFYIFFPALLFWASAAAAQDAVVHAVPVGVDAVILRDTAGMVPLRGVREVLRERQLPDAELNDADTMAMIYLPPVTVFARKKDFRRYQRIVNAVKKVYPYAKDAGQYMATLETELSKLTTQRERDRFTKQMEKEIVKKYSPVLENMTRTEGKILIKLIDRETKKTSYEILKEFRGGFSAGFWNTIAKLFKTDLKEGYDAEGEDSYIEEIIKYYEAGLL